MQAEDVSLYRCEAYSFTVFCGCSLGVKNSTQLEVEAQLICKITEDFREQRYFK